MLTNVPSPQSLQAVQVSVLFAMLKLPAAQLSHVRLLLVLPNCAT